MPFVNYSTKEINCTVGYFGPAVAARLRSQQLMHAGLRPVDRSKILSIGNGSGQVQQFDFLAYEIGTLRGMPFRAHLYCSDYEGINVVEHSLLKRIDGIIFVASTDPARMADNLSSLHALNSLLADLRSRPTDQPLFALQYHDDGGEALSTEAMNQQLNSTGHPTFNSADHHEGGVKEAVKDLLQRIRRQAMG
ncbi:MAG: hypothetical protein R3F15_06525 [Lysobacterales bacterium]